MGKKKIVLYIGYINSITNGIIKMRVANKRWGEVTIKRQGEEKNKFDKSKSFSVVKAKNEYTIEQLKQILEIVINLTDMYKFEELKKQLEKI